jgi:predicted GNAT family acetyltransferase
MAEHPLDRPVWSALTSRQSCLAEGDGRALRFVADHGVFAASADATPESLAALTALIPADNVVWTVEAGEMPQPPGTILMKAASCCQMVCPTLRGGVPPRFAVEELGDGDAAEMLALATLTEPGPFFARTHRLGGFVGVKQDGRLVAMAGERMKPDGFTEVSGVCTHPDFRGQGYAAGLMRIVIDRILARGEMPFLHVYATNAGAIALYETLGFGVRTTVGVRVLGRADSNP